MNIILYLFYTNVFINKSLIVLKSGTSYISLNLSSLIKAWPLLIDSIKELFVIHTVLSILYLLKLVRSVLMSMKYFIIPESRI